MNCPDKGFIQAWIDDELSETEKSAFDNHLRHCAGCRTTFAKLREGIAGIRGRLLDLDPPPVAVPSFETVPGSTAEANRPNSALASTQMVVSVRFLRVAAAAAVFLTIGIVGGLTQLDRERAYDDRAVLLVEAEPVVLNPNRSWHNRELFVSVVSTDSAVGTTTIVTGTEADKPSEP
jgi:anti-sigma factor RsiW